MKIPPVRVCISDDEIEWLKTKFDEVLRSGMLTSNKYVKDFEDSFANFFGIKHAIAVNSGTSAIEIPLRIFNVKNKNVLVPTNTFYATAGAVKHSGGKIKFLECETNSLSITPDDLESSIDKNTAGVVVVHIGGIVNPHMNKIREICDDHEIFLLEDCAHAHGGVYDGKFAGTFGDAASFSFFPTKVMTTCEGGMIITNDDDIAKRARIFRNQGMSWEIGNVNVELGYNWRMSEIHALVGISQLRSLPSFLEQRRKAANLYDKKLKQIKELENVKIPENSLSSYYKYITYLPDEVDRSEFKKTLKEKFNISLSGEVYDRPLHLQPIFENVGYKEGSFPIAEDICQRQICLPIFSDMTEEEVDYVVHGISEVLQ